MEASEEWEKRVILALQEQHKKYLRALDHHDGYEQCRSIGAVRIHAERLHTVYGLTHEEISDLILQAAMEYQKEKAGQNGRLRCPV